MGISGRPDEDEGSAYDEDENDAPQDEGSYYSEGSYRSGEGSYRSGEGSYRSGEGSYRSGEGSYRDKEGSYRSGEGSYRSGEGSYRSGEGSYRSGEGSYLSGEGSYRSGEGSYRDDERSHYSGEGSYDSRERSYRSGDGSYRDEERSYRSGEGSYDSRERSYRSGDGSYRSGEGSYDSRDRSQGSYRGNEESFRSNEGSYRSGEGSYRSGQESYRENGESFRSGEGSQTSKGPQHEGNGSVEGSNHSEKDPDEGVVAGSDHPQHEQSSEHYDEGSYQSNQESFRSGQDEKSYRSGQDSYRSGDGEGSAAQESYRSGEERSHQSGDQSYHSGDRSYDSREASYRSEDEHQPPLEESFVSEESDSSGNSFAGDDDEVQNLQDSKSATRRKNVSNQMSIQSNDFTIVSGYESDGRSFHSSDLENDQSSRDGVDDSEEPHSEQNERHTSPNASFQNSKLSMAASSHVSDTPSFADDTITSPQKKTSKASTKDNASFQNGEANDNIIDEDARAPADDGFAGSDFAKGAFDGQTSETEEQGDGFDKNAFGSDAFSGDAFDNTAFEKTDGIDAFGGGFGDDHAFGNTNAGFGSGEDAFDVNAFGGATDAFDVDHGGFDDNAFGGVNDAFGGDNAGFNETAFADDTFGFPGAEEQASGFEDFGNAEKKADSSVHGETDLAQPDEVGILTHETAAGESTQSFQQEAGAATEPESAQTSFGAEFEDGDSANESSGSAPNDRSDDPEKSRDANLDSPADFGNSGAETSPAHSESEDPNSEGGNAETASLPSSEPESSKMEQRTDQMEDSFGKQPQDSFSSAKKEGSGLSETDGETPETNPEGSFHSSIGSSVQPPDEDHGHDSYSSAVLLTEEQQTVEGQTKESEVSEPNGNVSAASGEDEGVTALENEIEVDQTPDAAETTVGDEERSGSFMGEDEARFSDEESHVSDHASFEGDEGSYVSGERSARSTSFHSDQGSYISDGRSFHSGDISKDELDLKNEQEDEDIDIEDGTIESKGSSHNSEELNDEATRTDNDTYRNGGDSLISGDASLISHEPSLMTNNESYRSEKDSYHSGTHRSGEDSHTDQGSQIGEESYHSEDASLQLRDLGHESDEEVTDDREGSNRSNEGSYVSGEQSKRSDKESGSIKDKGASIEDDAVSQQSEQSMGIGDVFGKPNESFEGSEEQGKASGESGTVSASEHDKDGGDERESKPVSEDDEIAAKARSERKSKENEDPEARRKRRRKKKKLHREAKSRALLELFANVNDAMVQMEELDAEFSEEKEANLDTSAHRLLHGFDALIGVLLQLSDELELLTTLEKAKKKKDRDSMIVPIQALKAVLSFAATLDELFADLKPIILDCFEEEPDDDMDDMLYRLNSLVDLLCETTHRVGEKQEWNERVETVYVTLIELMERETIELISYVDNEPIEEQGLSPAIHEAWAATGHIEELRNLSYQDDPLYFRQVCYEVMVSTDQWCPDTTILMEICDIDPSMLEEEPDPEYLEDDDYAPIPQAAEHVLDKVNGEPLPRTMVMASILRRILPPRAVTDQTLLDNFTSLRNTLDNPLQLPATNIVSITSVPEQVSDPDAQGVGGVGKTTLAAMVAQHPDVRKYFVDGVVWVYVGDKELNYNRYTQCLRELLAQLDFYQGIPLFAELVHVPGEPLSKRRRREEGFMIYARDTIAELLHQRSVLIILDDVCFEPDLDWFDFAPLPDEEEDEFDSNCALLVTTRCRSLLPAADTVEVDMLDEADAIQLLIQESGQLSHALMAESREARSVVQECANHPLAVKSVGRWLNLKHATAGVVSSVEEIHSEVIKSMDRILQGGDHTGTDMMYEILSMSLAPAVNGEATGIIKFCLAAFIIVFCEPDHISDFALTEPTPIIPMDMAELLFERLLEMNESLLLQIGSLFHAQRKEAAVLIPEALSALGVLKVITYSDAEDEEEEQDEQKFLQVMHFIHHEYGEHLCYEDELLKDLTKDAERQWNRALVEAYLSRVDEWDMNLEDAAHNYALEMIISHMIRGGMYSAAADLMADRSFVRGRLLSLGRENSTRRHVKDCEMLFKKLKERRSKASKLEPRSVMKQAYQALGSQLAMDDDDEELLDPRIKDVEVARAHYEIGFSLADKRCWDAAIAHWETSKELLDSALGTVEVVAGILFNIGVVYSEMNEYEQALDSLKQCLRIRGTIHGEDHILYAQTIQKIGDIFLGMSDYHEAMESYNWALDVMYIDPSMHRVEIGEILDNKGAIHYSKGEIDEALQCHQDALGSKQVDLGEDHPELAGTYHHIGNCLSDQGNVEEAIVHFEEAIKLKEMDPDGGPERDADVLTIEGILHNLEANQEQGLECYEKALQILVTKVPHRKEKVAALLHLIGCVYLMSGEQKKAMKLFEESLQARRKVLGFVHLDVASTLFNMAFLHQTRNKLDKALKCLEEALKIRQLRLPDGEKVAVTHEKIGSLAREIGKTKKAQINFEDALRIRRLLHGEQHEAVAAVLQELGDLMDDLGEYDSAMTHYIDALDIRRNRLGVDDIAVAETMYSMGYTLHNNNEADRALVCFEEALSIRRYQLGEDSKEVGDTLNMMGFLKAKRGELDDALSLLWDALRIRKLQEDFIKVSETLKNIGNVHREKKEHDLAVDCYEECLRIRRTHLGVEHEKVADALIAMGNVKSDMNQTDEAMKLYQEALKIRTKAFGEHDESVASVLQYMGTMEFRSNNYEKAKDLLTEFVRIRRDNNSKNDGDYVNVLFMIGNIHKMQGHEDEAQMCWFEAYSVFKELGLAEDNPQIFKVMNHLLKFEEDRELEEQKKKAKSNNVFGMVSEKLKSKPSKEGKKKRRKGKGIQL